MTTTRPIKAVKKPVEIEAWQWDGSSHDLHRICAWVLEGGHRAYIQDNSKDQGPDLLKIVTLEGEMTVLKSDWVIKGVNGEFYPCKPDIFDKTYDKGGVMSDGDITVLGPECFASTDDTVISWRGENFYKSCDEPVVQNEDGSGTHCVKRVGHPGDIHEDYDGARVGDPKGRMIVTVSFPLAENPKQGHEETQAVLHTLRPHFQEKKDVLIYAAILEQADQIIMILEGDG